VRAGSAAASSPGRARNTEARLKKLLVRIALGLKKFRVRILLGLAITLFFVGHAAQFYRIAYIEGVDNDIYDARLRLTMPDQGDSRIVILDIDEKSLGEIGRWPWSRNVMARLMDKLFDQYKVKLVGFDIIWAERDTSSGIDVLDALARNELKGAAEYQERYRKLRAGIDYDAQFAASIKGRPVVLGYYFNKEENAVKANALPPPVLPKGSFAGREIPFAKWNGYTGNLPVFMANAAAAGHFTPEVDDDGVVRRVPMLIEYDGAYYEPLSLAMVRLLLALETGTLPPIEPMFPAGRPGADHYGGLESIAVGPFVIPVDDKVAALIPYRGPQATFTYVSLGDVLSDRVKPELLRGKIALVGTTAPGLKDLRSTPVGSVYPGVEIHANIIASVISGDMKQKPEYILGAEIMLLLAGGLVLSLLIPTLSAAWATLAALSGAAIITGFDFMLWSRAGIVLPLATSLLMTAVVYIMNMAYGYFVESRSKRQFTELFGQYVPPELVDRMATDPEKYSMEPKAADLTILFADVRKFTSISEALGPEDLREFINDYLSEMSSIIRANQNGTLDKYIGDAIMAFWGAPMDDAQHTRHGVLAAMQMQKACLALNAKFSARGWPRLRIGIGVNSGNVRVGDMGSRVRRAYTVMGDPVNVSSRLEGRTKHYKVGILVGEATRDAVSGVVFREVDKIKVKGKDAALVIYEPIGLEEEVGPGMRNELQLWDRALRAYRARQWDEADAILAELRHIDADNGMYERFMERIAAFRHKPPPDDWGGVTAFEEK
jgi:adenylate cyclase